MLFDTHCHLNIEDLSSNLDEVISEAKKNGIEKILIPGVTINSSKLALEIANKYEDIWAGVGIHPTDQEEKTDVDNQIVELEKIILEEKVVAVGEIGLDYHKNPSLEEKEYQKKLFIAQLDLAFRHKKPIIIHNRESKADMIQILNSHWYDSFSQKMVFHCCEPDADLLSFAKDKEIFIGIDGDITYKKSKQEFIKNIPLEMLILETDSPFLIPEPLKSQKIFPNGPKNLNLISNYVSDLLGVNRNLFEKQIWENSNKLFFD